MSDSELPNERRYARFLTEMDLVLSSGGKPLDETAQAVDISAAGFRAVTRAELKEGQVVDFELVLVGANEKVKGRGKVVWASRDAFQFDFWSAGIKITKMSWRDSSKLRSDVYEAGYDFAGLAKNMFWALYIIIVAAAVQNVLFHQPQARHIIWKLMPVIAALGVLAASLFALLG